MDVNKKMSQMPSKDISPEGREFFQKVTDFKEKLFVYFRSITKSISMAEDFTQEVLLTIHEQYALGLYREQGKLEHYIMKIAANILKGYLRKKRRHRNGMNDHKADIYRNFGWSEPTYDYLTVTTAEADTRVKEDIVDKLFNKKFDFVFLNSDERRILRMRHGDNYSFAQISEVFDLPITSVALKYRIAIRKIRTAVKKGFVR